MKTFFRQAFLASSLVFFTLSARSQSTEDSAHLKAKEVHATNVGGYGEFALHDPNGSEKARLDIPRFTIDIDHDFSEKWTLESEVEIEHVKLERAVGGEIALEEAFLDYHGSDKLGWRGGLMLIPMGIMNQTHEPNTFYSVDRPLFDQAVIPTTWREIATGIYGAFGESVDYQLYVTEGLKAQDITMEGVDGAKQEGSAGELTSDNIAGSDASHPAISAKINVMPIEGLKVGASAYVQPDAFDSLPAGVSGRFVMAMLDAQYETGGLRLRGEGGMFTVSEDATRHYDMAQKAVGGYLEAAYNVMPWIGACQSELRPFGRYESFAFTNGLMFADVPNRLATKTTTVTTVGLAFKPLDNLIVKTDYQWIASDGVPNRKQFNFGAGYSY